MASQDKALTDSEGRYSMNITGVTLFDNGYAVFERETTIQGNGHIDLYFPSSLMKSVLDSLQFLGAAAPNVGNIAYEATKPTATVEISQDDPMFTLIKTLIGNHVALQMKDDTLVDGRILGTDRVEHHDNYVLHVSMYLAGGTLATYPVTDIKKVSLIDEQIKRDINFSLDLTQNKSKDDMQKLSVFFSNVDTPQILIARYGFKVNEWKSSYRMTFATDQSTSFMLHGLAIIENSLWEDWNDVKVTLVVGAPSIVSSTDVSDEGVWKLVIKALDGSTLNVRANPKDPVLRVKAKIGKKKNINPFTFKLVFCGKTVEDGRQLSDYTISDNAVLHMAEIDGVSTRSLRSSEGTSQTQFVMAAQDNLSHYQIPMHVTAQRKQKAIVTMLQAKLEGQRVVLYDETIRKGNPLSAILFENTTGRTLEGGSLIFTTPEAFLGQSTLPTLSQGDESPPIPYAVELGCEVIKSNDRTSLPPHRVEIADGTIAFYRINREVTIYRISNKSDKELDFLLNHLFLEQYELVQTGNTEEEEPVDITDRFYQFRFIIEPKLEKKSFLVREEITDRKEHSIVSLNRDDFDRWSERGYFDKPTIAAITRVYELRKEITSTERMIYEDEGEVREIKKTQDHIRQNISALEHHSRQAASYIKSLEEEEGKLKLAQERIKAARLKKKELEKRRDETVNGVKFSLDIKRDAPIEEAAQK
jgi:hypothetical protein